jgi:ArsR family transcriptional regulator
MQTDRARLSKACCSQVKFAALQGAPLPIPVDSPIASEAR